MVNGEDFEWFKAQVDADAESIEAVQPEDDSIDRWADDGGNIPQPRREDKPERYCERTGCFQPGTVQRLIPVSRVRSDWLFFCSEHVPTGYTKFHLTN